MTRYQAYQGHQIEGAGPLGLILLSYEALYKSLARARLAIEAGDLAAEADHTGRSMEAIIELSSSLNMTDGAEVAENLSSLYMYMMNRLTEGLCSCSTQHVDEVMHLVQELREGWLALNANQQKQGRSVPREAAAQQIRAAA